MTALTLMVQGTASGVGKSLVATGLCRLFARAGLRVAPFKALNMALESAVAHDGGEIGRAQLAQAEAAGVPASVHMNPVLLKPEGDGRCQVVVQGRPWARLMAGDAGDRTAALRAVVAESLARVRAEADLVVIEGAGSPVEVNLADRDVVNMHVARLADAPVVLVGDIDRGGVFASLVGTMELLDPGDRARVKGLLINRFRGERGQLATGLSFLERRCGVPVLGVVPWLPGHGVADEDAVALDDRRIRPAGPGELFVAVVRLPRISNFDDFRPLEEEPGVVVRYVDRPDELRGADLVVLPGSKGTAADLSWLRAVGLAEAVHARAQRGEPLLGICGGCQMLGGPIEDPGGFESEVTRADGLGLLPLATRFGPTKVTARVRARPVAAGLLLPPGEREVEGYELHMGDVRRVDGGAPAFTITERNGVPVRIADGAASPDGAIVGTLLHGVLHDPEVRQALLARLRARRGSAPSAGTPAAGDRYDRLARALLDAMDWRQLCGIAGVEAPRPELGGEPRR